MSDSQLSQVDRLRRSLEVLEAQRENLGRKAIDPAIFALEQQIAAYDISQRVIEDQDEERLIVTILFTDIIGSSAIAARLDPEDWRAVVAAVHTMAGKKVQEYGGTVIQYLGDGLLALFGVQRSSERDPENAVRAALEIQASIPTLESDVPVQLRVGINTGLVVVGELGSDAKLELTASGDAMNLADRIQKASPPGGVLISQTTYRHVRGVFEMTQQVPIAIKGRSHSLQTYLVSDYKILPYRIATRGVTGVETQTVGREIETGELQAAYQEAIEMRKVVWAQLVGSPGIGKSRLLFDYLEILETQHGEATFLWTFSTEGDLNDPYALIRRMWFNYLQIPEDASLSVAEELWIEGIKSILGENSKEAAHALGLLLGLPFNESPYIGAMRKDPMQLKNRSITVGRNLLNQLRRTGSLIITIEDLHWTDPSSWDYLTNVFLDLPSRENGEFIFASARPEWKPTEALLSHPGYRQIDLLPLNEAASNILATDLLQRVDLIPEKILDLIAIRSEGVPYYAEEIVNWFLDQGILDRRNDPWQFISTVFESSPFPATLQHLLQTRLTSLSKNKRSVLQCGAVFGRNFWESGIRALGANTEPEIFEDLQKRGLIETPRTPSFESEHEWRFQHDLMREAVYESILKRTRPDLHREAGDWLECQAIRTGRTDELSGRIGEHAEQAGRASAAADWYIRAGRGARNRGALPESLAFFEQSLKLLSDDDGGRRWHVLLDISEVLGILSEPELRKETDTVILELANKSGDQYKIAEANYRRGSHLESLGDPRAALDYFEIALEASKLAQEQTLEASISALMVVCYSRLGEMTKAERYTEKALELSQRVDDENARARILANASVYYGESGEIAKAAKLEEQQIKICHNLGDRFGQAMGLGNVGYHYLQLGLFEKGVVALERALELNEAFGALRPYSYNILNLGLALWRKGESRNAVQLIESAHSGFEAHGDVFGIGVLHSYKAMAMEHIGDLEGASTLYKEGKAIFERIGLHGFAHDALAGLARCAMKEGDYKEARTHVTELNSYLNMHEAKNMEFPIWAFQTCASMYIDIGDEEKSHKAIKRGYGELMSRADKISDPEWRESFLVNVQENCELIKMWEQIPEYPA
jgi:predicted ATPase/class 3 adenylate cyclase